MVNSTSGTKKALVVGAGIAGLATAKALKLAGWEPQIVERAPGRRRGGYFIMMFGSGRIAADHLGITGIRPRNARGAKNYRLDRSGRKQESVGFVDLPAKPWMMLRGDVEQAAFDALEGNVPIRFETSPTRITQESGRVQVSLRSTADGSEQVEEFDLVVGADGVRSTVRELVWGPHSEYLNRMGDMICAYEMPRALPGLNVRDGASVIEPGRSFTVFNFEDHAPTVLFSYKSEDIDADRARGKQIGVANRLREVYGPEPLGPVMDAALEHLETADQFLFDSVEQTRVDRWSRGRVLLLGDAAWCPTLYSGMGATSSLSGADVLRVMLQKHPDSVEEALAAWEKKLREPIHSFQKSALPMRSLFTVDSEKEIARKGRTELLFKFMFTFPPARKVFANLPSFRLRNSDLAA